MSDTSLSEEHPINTGCVNVVTGLINRVKNYTNNKNYKEETKPLTKHKEVIYTTDI